MVWTRTAWVVGCICCAAVAWGQVPAADARASFDASVKRIADLREHDRPEEAVAVAEEFLRQFPQAMPYSRWAAGQVSVILSKDLTDPPKKLAICQRAYTQFEASPEYYCMGALSVAEDRMWRGNDTVGATEVLDAVDAKLGDKLPVDWYAGYALLALRVWVTIKGGDYEHAIEQAKEFSQRSPWLLGSLSFMRALGYAMRQQDAVTHKGQAVSAAKALYVLSEFSDSAVQEAVDAVSVAFTAAQGPGVSLQFVKAQDDASVTNPLREVPLPDLGDTEAMLKVVGQDPAARLNILFYAGRHAEALEIAKAQLRAARGTAAVASALRAFARCFKAHDLNLVRGNQFLKFHGTGEGENPLPALEKELAQP